MDSQAAYEQVKRDMVRAKEVHFRFDGTVYSENWMEECAEQWQQAEQRGFLARTGDWCPVPILDALSTGENTLICPMRFVWMRPGLYVATTREDGMWQVKVDSKHVVYRAETLKAALDYVEQHYS